MWPILFFLKIYIYIYTGMRTHIQNRGFHGVMFTVEENGHDDLSSNSWTRLFASYIVQMPLEKVWIQLFSLQLYVNSRLD